MDVIVSAEPVESKGDKKKKEYDKWEIEDAYRTLKRAEEVKNTPELMKLISKEYDKDLKAIKSLSSLKNLASKAMADEADMED